MCGHVTTYAIQALYKSYRPRGKYFCEACGSYSKRQPKPRYDPLPDEPPF